MKKPIDYFKLIKNHIHETHKSVKVWINELDTFGYFDFDRDTDEFEFWYEDIETGRKQRYYGNLLFGISQITDESFVLNVLSLVEAEVDGEKDFLYKEVAFTLRMFPPHVNDITNGWWKKEEDEINALKAEYHKMFEPVIKKWQEYEKMEQERIKEGLGITVLKKTFTEEQLKWMDERGVLKTMIDTVVSWKDEKEAV